MPRVDLHALPGFVVLCQSTDFVRKGGDFLDLLAFHHIRGIEFYAHQVLVYNVLGGTEQIILEIRSPWGCHWALTDWERGTVPGALP